MLALVSLILGAGLLLAGRRLFWLFIAAVGFMAGAQLATRVWGGSEWTSIVVGIVLGLLFAGLALFFKSLAIGIAGFIGGGSILLSLAGFVGLDSGATAWVVFFIGGLIGIALLTQVFDWAIIFLSSIGGASLITQAIGLPAFATSAAFIVLIVVGVAIQAKVLSGEKGHD
jgi:hypothetical protein